MKNVFIFMGLFRKKKNEFFIILKFIEVEWLRLFVSIKQYITVRISIVWYFIVIFFVDGFCGFRIKSALLSVEIPHKNGKEIVSSLRGTAFTDLIRILDFLLNQVNDCWDDFILFFLTLTSQSQAFDLGFESTISIGVENIHFPPILTTEQTLTRITTSQGKKLKSNLKPMNSI
jgi:hypothetical protein